MKIYLIGQKGIPAHGGGIERHVEELATRLVREGHEVFAYARTHYTNSSVTQYKGVQLIHLPTLHSKHLDAIIHTLFATLHVLFQRADIIHYHAIGPASLLWIPRFLKPRATVVFTFHCQDYHHQKWNWIARVALRIGEAIGCRFAHRVITVSKTLTDYAWAAYQVPATYIPNGAVAEATRTRIANGCMKTLGLERNGYILAVARLVRHKGVHDLVAAYQTLTCPEHGRGATKKKLVIVGSGAFTDDYVRELHTLAHGNPNILFLGNQTGNVLSALYENAYLLVQPSYAEGLSVVLLEALSNRLCVLSSNIPENREVVDGIGYTFKTGSVRDLSSKLRFLLARPGLVHRAGCLGKKRASKDYAWSAIVPATERVYRTALARSPLEQTSMKTLSASR